VDGFRLRWQGRACEGRGWLRDQRGDMVWNALVIVAVLLPLAGLTIDVPRAFILRARLQAACNAASEAAARAIDVPRFRDTGEVRLDAGKALAGAQSYFAAGTSSLAGGGYQPAMTGFIIDAGQRAVTVRATGLMRAMFGLVGDFQVSTASTSWYRMDRR
jgi:uncharacterized membrane protein